jgi:hypothetical protein
MTDQETDNVCNSSRTWLRHRKEHRETELELSSVRSDHPAMSRAANIPERWPATSYRLLAVISQTETFRSQCSLPT